MGPGPGPGPWSRALGPGPGPGSWARALVPGPGPGPWSRALGRVRKNQNPKSSCVVKKMFRGSRYARIDPSRRVIMTEPIFVLHKI